MNNELKKFTVPLEYKVTVKLPPTNNGRKWTKDSRARFYKQIEKTLWKLGNPVCINHGCKTKVEFTKHGRPMPHCGNCRKAGQGRSSYKPGVTPFKKNRCDNDDCPTNKSLSYWTRQFPLGKKFPTELDHKDGDPWNNVIENMQEFCQPCHKVKTWKNEDHKKKENCRTKVLSVGPYVEEVCIHGVWKKVA